MVTQMAVRCKKAKERDERMEEEGTKEGEKKTTEATLANADTHKHKGTHMHIQTPHSETCCANYWVRKSFKGPCSPCVTPHLFTHMHAGRCTPSRYRSRCVMSAPAGSAGDAMQTVICIGSNQREGSAAIRDISSVVLSGPEGGNAKRVGTR